MIELLNALRQQWKVSVSFRVWTILAAVAMVFSVFLSALWQLGLLSIDEMPPLTDLQIYLNASHRFLQRQDLYIAPRASFELYAYSPAFAMVLSPLTWLPYQFLLACDVILHIAAYAVLYWRWFVIFRRYRLEAAEGVLIRTLPLWLVFTGFWYDTSTLNIYIFMALLATLLLEAILSEQVGWSVLWLSILMLIKPQWAFALGVPVLLGRWRFFGKVLAGGILVYLGTMLVEALIAGPSYILDQHRAYVQFLQSIPTTFFWNTLAESGHIGYNNSVMQLVAFFTNDAPYKTALTYGIKFLLLLPLLIILWFNYRRTDGSITPGFKLEWAFSLYLAAFILIDVITEITLSIAVFVYLLGTLQSRRSKIAACIVFLPYALQMLWILIAQIISFFIPLPAFVYDPSLYIPYALLAMLGLYAILLVELLAVRRRVENMGVAGIDLSGRA
jgi:hypothetical protein